MRNAVRERKCHTIDTFRSPDRNLGTGSLGLAGPWLQVGDCWFPYRDGRANGLRDDRNKTVAFGSRVDYDPATSERSRTSRGIRAA